jgi:hypothetical protein
MVYARYHKDVTVPVLGPVRLHWDFEASDPLVYPITSQDEEIVWILPRDWYWWTPLGVEVFLEHYITGQDIRDAIYNED